MKYTRRLSQKGDTIVEVLICLAIFGAMLAAAFALTARNQSTSQAAQERSVAIKVADSQLEQLRAYTDNYKLPALPEFNYFCMQSDGTPFKLATPVATPECKTGDDNRYSYVIWSPEKAAEVGGNGDTYAVTVRWEGLLNKATGSNIEEVKIFYSIWDTSNPAQATNAEDLAASPACSDGKDNDGDGKVDFPADPGCKTPQGTDETDPIEGYITAAGDCYAPGDINAGCPTLHAVFTWSDGSTNPLDCDVNVRYPILVSGGQRCEYSFVKNPGVTLSTVKVNMVSDKFDVTPNKDRNLYIYSLTHNGTTYSHTQATPTPCLPGGAGPGFYAGSDAKWLCGVDPVTFFLDGAASDLDSGAIIATGECYIPDDVNGGCPVMRTQYAFSDGSVHPTTFTVPVKSGEFSEYPFYGFNKPPGVTITKITIYMDVDSAGTTPPGDRNLYVQGIKYRGMEYGYSAHSTTTSCDSVTNMVQAYPLSGSSRFLCRTEATVFTLN